MESKNTSPLNKNLGAAMLETALNATAPETSEPEPIDPAIEVRSAFRAYLKAPQKVENRRALIATMDRYELGAFERRLAALKAEFGKV